MFVTFEGGEGSGKSTVSYEIWKRLRRGREDAILTREPGGTSIAEAIRGVIIGKHEEEMSIKTEVLLFAAARHEHIKNKIIPALKENKIVLCDRFVDSSLVYQGMNPGSDGVAMVKWINRYIDEDVMPDIIFFMDIEPEVALERIRKNQRETNRFDEKEITYHRQVREEYLKLAQTKPERYIRIDASQSEEDVLNEVWEKFEQRRSLLNDQKENWYNRSGDSLNFFNDGIPLNYSFLDEQE